MKLDPFNIYGISVFFVLELFQSERGVSCDRLIECCIDPSVDQVVWRELCKTRDGHYCADYEFKLSQRVTMGEMHT